MEIITAKISILIANYNNGHFFQDCYNSLIAQTYQDFEVIIIDDSSTDNSVEVIKNIIENDPRFKFHQNNTNLGYQKTILKAIDLSTSPIFGRLDPDDALTERAIELSLKTHYENPEVGLVYANFILSDENLYPISIHKAKQVNSIDSLEYFNFQTEISHFATFKQKFYQLTEGIDCNNKRAEDKDIYMKMCEIAPVKYIDEDLYLYRIHQGGISNNKNVDKAYFWHWVAIIKMAERRNINVEDLFLEKFVRIEHCHQKDLQIEALQYKLSLIQKNRWLKLGAKLGLVKFFKYL